MYVNVYPLDVGFMSVINPFLFIFYIKNKGDDYVALFLRLRHSILNMGLYT